MRKIFLLLFLIAALHATAQDEYQLAPPLLKYSSVFFKDKAVLTMSFRHPGAVIRYTTDGTAPNEKSRVYTNQLSVTALQQTIRARSFAPGFKPSDVVAVSFVKDGIPVKNITVTAPDPAYSAKGMRTLYDNAGGSTDLHGGTWLGYMKDTVEFIVDAGTARPMKKILLSVLQQKGSWIYLPVWVTVDKWNGATKSFQSFMSYDFSGNEKAEDGIVFRDLIFPKGTVAGKLRIHIGTLKKIPAGLPGENESGWLFIDEIKLF